MGIPLKRLIWQWHVVVITAPILASLVILVRLSGALQALEWAMFDQYISWRPPEPRDDRIVVVGISESDLETYGWPLPDAILADLIETLNQQHPRAIGLDLYRNFPVEPGYDRLIQVFEATPNLIGIEKVVGGVAAGPIAPATVLHDLNQVGANDAVLDADGRLRRGFLYLDDADGNVVFSLAQRLAFLYLDAEAITPSVTEEGAIRLGEALFVPFAANDGAYIRANDRGFQLLIHFRGARGFFPSVSVQQVLENQIPLDLMRDRIVLIGSVAESVTDYFQTPFSSRVEKQLPQLMAGVEIKANLTSQILSAALEGRPMMRSWSDPVEWVWILVWATVGATISWQQRRGSQSIQTQWLRTSLSIALAGAGLLGVGYLAFLASWWIPVIPPLAALLGAAVVVTAHIAQMAVEIRKTFGRYLTDEVVTSFLETPTGLQLGGEKRRITILMSDLRGFSTISERLPPEQVVKLLNLYLDAMTEVISQYQGLINQVIGDGMVILFGALHQAPDDAERAVACAIAMQLAMDAVNQTNQLLNLPTIEMGIGVHSGDVVVGNIGSLKHAQFTAIGSDMNLVARIESSSVGGQVLVSQAVRDGVPDLKIRRDIQARLKGVHATVTLYDVAGIGGRYNVRLPHPQDDLAILRQDVPIQYTLVEDKQVVGVPIQARMVKFSIRGAEIHSDQAIAPLSNIRINLVLPAVNGIDAEDIYAKVTDSTIDRVENSLSDSATDSMQVFRIHFTDISPQVIATLLKLIYD